MVAEEFTVRVVVRGYEIDANGHVNQAVYHQYGEHARTEHLRAAGFSAQAYQEGNLGTVVLESTIRYLRELNIGDEVDVTSRIEFGAGKAFRFEHELRRLSDGVVAAEISCVAGVLDKGTRRLVAEPARRLAELLDRPEVLGIS
ncbi:hypothetical protein GCM10023321_33740 [Pseudonocardia eucalypti]|uniref:Acyl-CoA thioester hydrolase n=1 Tax=Pseudonocardia eucalypti TaxID=648755 RepID=A0ABP9Q588_9PSEU|nr:acyl-CoA thioester hydrolase [Pseudonocardia eucalypti]